MACTNVSHPYHRKTNVPLVHGAKLANYLRPMRVVSLVPSWTEFLHDLSVDVVGQTKFCVRPPEAFRRVPRVGGTKTADVKAILALKPDLVVANLEENDREQVEALQEALPSSAEVWVSDVRTVRQAWQSMEELGQRVERSHEARHMTQAIQENWGEPKPLVAEAGYAVWRAPWMVAGHDTFIHDVMRWWGIGNAVGPDLPGRYPTLAQEDVNGLRSADTWLLPSEPFPFADKHLARYRECQPDARMMLVDGEAFSWYGSRMAHAHRHLNDVREALRTSPTCCQEGT